MSINEFNTIIQQKQQDGSFVKIYPVTKTGNVKDENGKDLPTMLSEKAEAVHDHDYISDVPSTVEVGGIEKGFTTEGMTLEEIVFKLLHKYVAPGVAFSGTTGSSTLELGSKIATTTFTATGRREADKIQRIRIYKDNAVVHTHDNVDGTGNVSTTYTDTNVAKNASYKADVFDGKNTVTSGAINYTFVHPIYLGALDASITNPTSDQVKTLTKRIAGKSNQDFTYTIDNKRMCFISLFELREIIDPNQFNITSSFAKMKVNVECLDGSTQSYFAYISAPTSQTNFKVSYRV